MSKKTLFFCLMLLCVSCYRVPSQIEPKVSLVIEDSYLKKLSSPFTPLSVIEKKEDWGKEFIIATSFAKELDLYRAITTYKRAKVLLDGAAPNRSLEIDYDIFLCYYLGQKYEDAIDAFEKSDLAHVNKQSFTAFHDLLVLLYDSYKRAHDTAKSQKVLDAIELNYPETKKKLLLSDALREADLKNIPHLSKNSPDKKEIHSMVYSYEKEKKSIAKAQALNALIPGSGYLYLGQKKSAFTSVLVNAAFIWASYEFFHKGFIAAGIITTSIEAGWYFGGIYGAGLEAKYYNEHLYEKKASKLMNQKGLFPLCLLEFTF